jgi:hypothetical protein
MTTSAPASPSRPPHTNVFARHWCGELPLWVSFWIVGVGLYVGGAFFVFGMLMAHDAVAARLPRGGAILVLLLTAVIQLAAMVFAGVGIWRAATYDNRIRRERGRTPLWGWAAKACVAVLGYLYYIGPLQKITGG